MVSAGLCDSKKTTVSLSRRVEWPFQVTNTDEDGCARSFMVMSGLISMMGKTDGDASFLQFGTWFKLQTSKMARKNLRLERFKVRGAR